MVRADAPGGLFTFERIDVGQFGLGVTAIDVTGYLGGVEQGTDTFLTPADANVYATVGSVLLAGKPIDELQVRLDGSRRLAGVKEVDNIVLTPLGAAPVPEPATLATLGGWPSAGWATPAGGRPPDAHQGVGVERGVRV